jgi:hypothetical protein
MLTLEEFAETMPDSALRGFDDSHTVENIVFENLRIHDKVVLDAAAGGVKIGPYVKNVIFFAGGE